MLYNYGPLRLSLLRGLAFTTLVPVVIVAIVSVANAFLYDQPFVDCWSTSWHTVRETYLDYPAVALVLHLTFFLKGLIYRRRHLNVIPLIVLIVILGRVLWAMSPQSHLLPAAAIAQIGTELGLPPPTHTPATHPEAPTPAASHPQPAPNPLAIELANPNQLQQRSSSVPPAITVRPDPDGQHFINGHIGPNAVVFQISPASNFSAVHPSAIPSHVPCISGHITFDGQVVEGCTARLDDVDLGAIELPPAILFVTDRLAPRRAVLGQDILAKLLITSHPDGGLTIQRRPAVTRP